MNTLNEFTNSSEMDYGKQKSMKMVKNVDREIRFTETYKKYAQEHPYIREIKCVEVQTKEILCPIQNEDWFAGRIDRITVGIDPERGDLTEAAYFCQYDLLNKQLENSDLSEKIKNDIQYLIEFWKKEDTYSKCRAAFPDHLSYGLPDDNYYCAKEISYPMYGLGGPCLNFDKLVSIGIEGLYTEIQESKKSKINAEEQIFLNASEAALQIFSDAALRYAAEAEKKGKEATDLILQKKYRLIQKSLTNIAFDKPENFHEAIQLVWLYCLVALPKNYGRMDVYLGDFLAADLDRKHITRNEALDMMVGLWRLIVARGDNFNNRIIIGGKGRRNSENADRFALLALEAQMIVNAPIPQLSLRWFEGMNTEILKKSFDVIAAGATFPIIYNDDVNIPAVEKAFEIPTSEAEQYMMYGCGEYVIDHLSIGSPDAALNVLKALDVTLNNGIDSYTGDAKGLQTGNFRDFKTFEQLQTAFIKQIDYQIGLLAEAQALIYDTTVKYAAYPFLSILYDNCIERGKPLLAGGVKYRGGTLESFGNNSAADALLAIKEIVYDKKIMCSDELLQCMKSNFDQSTKELNMLLTVPKYGNDSNSADEMSLWVNTVVCESAKKQKNKTSLDSFLVVLVNNGDSVTLGKATAASADGRKAGESMSNGNQPSAGNDKLGLTALLNSMAKLDPSLHAGATHNVKISRQMMMNNRIQVEALILGYFKNGGTQVMITVTDKEELEKAIKNPSEYSNLIVRVGGYSERFVDLPKDIQTEVIKRTLY